MPYSHYSSTLLVPLDSAGFLEPSLNVEDLPADVELELPLWVAQIMTRPKFGYLTVTLPKKYKDAYRYGSNHSSSPISSSVPFYALFQGGSQGGCDCG